MFKNNYNLTDKFEREDVAIILMSFEFKALPQPFKKNYPFYPLFILRIILFSKIMPWLCLKLRQGLTFSKDRKWIKTSELVEDIVDLVFVGQVCPTYNSDWV